MNKIFIALLAIALVSMNPTATVFADEGWEASITITSGSAKSRLSFGQRPDATNRKDNRYDAQAMLGGSLQVRFENEDADLWRDIRITGEAAEWQLIISAQTGSPIMISWEPVALPEGFSLELIDTNRNKVVDMKLVSDYSLSDHPEAELLISITSK